MAKVNRNFTWNNCINCKHHIEKDNSKNVLKTIGFCKFLLTERENILKLKVLSRPKLNTKKKVESIVVPGYDGLPISSGQVSSFPSSFAF